MIHLSDTMKTDEFKIIFNKYGLKFHLWEKVIGWIFSRRNLDKKEIQMNFLVFLSLYECSNTFICFGHKKRLNFWNDNKTWRKNASNAFCRHTKLFLVELPFEHKTFFVMKRESKTTNLKQHVTLQRKPTCKAFIGTLLPKRACLFICELVQVCPTLGLWV